MNGPLRNNLPTGMARKSFCAGIGIAVVLWDCLAIFVWYLCCNTYPTMNCGVTVWSNLSAKMNSKSPSINAKGTLPLARKGVHDAPKIILTLGQEYFSVLSGIGDGLVRFSLASIKSTAYKFMGREKWEMEIMGSSALKGVVVFPNEGLRQRGFLFVFEGLFYVLRRSQASWGVCRSKCDVHWVLKPSWAIEAIPGQSTKQSAFSESTDGGIAMPIPREDTIWFAESIFSSASEANDTENQFNFDLCPRTFWTVLLRPGGCWCPFEWRMEGPNVAAQGLNWAE